MFKRNLIKVYVLLWFITGCKISYKTYDFEDSPNSELKEEIVSLIEKSDHNLAKVLILGQNRLKWRKTTIPASLIKTIC